MEKMQIHSFGVSIDDKNRNAHVYLLWPCSEVTLRQFMMEKFEIETEGRDAWDGKCMTSAELDSNQGVPTAVLALRSWKLNPKEIAVLAHECFHAAEWILKASSYGAPVMNPGEPWEAWEDMAYLLQRIMRKALEGLSRVC